MIVMTTHFSRGTLRAAAFAALAAFGCITSHSAFAGDNKLYMMMTPNEVRGTREIELGNIDQGVRKSLLAINASAASQRVAAFTNLCIGYAKQGDLMAALEYCDKAVAEDRFADVAYTNRGAVHYLLGNYTNSVMDLRQALDLRADTMEARKNLQRAERGYASLQGNQNLAQDTAR